MDIKKDEKEIQKKAAEELKVEEEFQNLKVKDQELKEKLKELKKKKEAACCLIIKGKSTLKLGIDQNLTSHIKDGYKIMEDGEAKKAQIEKLICETEEELNS